MKAVKTYKGDAAIICPGCGYPHIIYLVGGSGAPNKTWSFNNNFDNPTFQPSLLCTSGIYADPDWKPSIPEDEDEDNIKYKSPPYSTRCHSFITNGNIQFLNDCTHELKGQTVPLPEWTDPDQIKGYTIGWN